MNIFCFFQFRFEPAANELPSSVFFPQINPDERLSQCSASLQALLALSPTTLHALSKLVNNADIADDIIGVIRNVVSQYPSKGSLDLDTNIEVPLSVRLWRVSGCHELLASLGFDLMEVGQDQVTLRTGKQANRRNCQFVLQALLALFDTQEAPKSLGIDSGSSCESLNEDMQRTENRVTSLSPVPPTQSSQSQKCSISPVGTVKSLNLKLPRPQLPNRPPILSNNSAFTSYVRKRGEPDGGRNEIDTNIIMQSNIELNTDSDISDYSSQMIKPKIDYSSLRTPIKVGRPGGGGESDAAFTPSPILVQNIDNNVSMALAHQTRIRNLYSTANNVPTSDAHVNLHKPDDSSSSASSTNDWDVSGHATVLRRAQQNHQNQLLGLPPMPPPRQTLPIDSLRPLATAYNNLGNNKNKSNSNVIESTSSDSDRTYESCDRNATQKLSHQQFISRKIPEECLLMDRLSVRTENTANIAPNTAPSRKPMQMSDSDAALPFKLNSNNLYFSSADSDIIEPQHKDISLTLKANSAKENTKPPLSSHSKNIQDLIMRQINREMTPTISDVYHERNIPHLGLAPPLSKLLLSKNYDDNESSTNTIKKANSTETLPDVNIASTISTDLCDKCKNTTPGGLCQCKNSSKILSSKQWLNNLVTSTPQSTGNNSQLSTSNDFSISDIKASRQIQNNLNVSENENTNPIENNNSSVNITAATLKRGASPYSDLSKRDEGDGRSVADSQCSSSNYKVVDLNATSKINQIQQRINKFNMNCANNTQN